MTNNRKTFGLIFTILSYITFAFALFIAVAGGGGVMFGELNPWRMAVVVLVVFLAALSLGLTGNWLSEGKLLPKSTRPASQSFKRATLGFLVLFFAPQFLLCTLGLLSSWNNWPMLSAAGIGMTITGLITAAAWKGYQKAAANTN